MLTMEELVRPLLFLSIKSNFSTWTTPQLVHYSPGQDKHCPITSISSTIYVKQNHCPKATTKWLQIPFQAMNATEKSNMQHYTS